MSKDGFVRDNLIDMRDHLKAAREAILAGTDPHEAARMAEAATAKTDPPKTAPGSTGNTDGADLRILREFSGRIIHDRSAIDAATQALELRRSELEKFRKVLDELDSQLSGSRNISDRQLERMQFTYYMAAGEFKGANSGRSDAAAAAAVASSEAKTFRQILLESLPLMVSVIAAAAVVSLTLLALFA